MIKHVRIYQWTLCAVAIMLFGFALGWISRAQCSGVWKTQQAFFLRLNGGKMECVLRPVFLKSLFGNNWQDQQLYINYFGGEGDQMWAVDGPYWPLKSLSLNIAVAQAKVPKGRRWNERFGLYSRKKELGCIFLVRMKAHELVVLKREPVHLPEKCLLNDAHSH